MKTKLTLPFFHHRFILEIDGVRREIVAREGEPLKVTGSVSVSDAERYMAWCEQISLFLIQETKRLRKLRKK